MTAGPIGNGQCVNGVGDMTEGGWYFIEVEYDLGNRTAHARVNGGDRGGNINLQVGTASGTTTNLFSAWSVWDNPPQFWIDDLRVTTNSPLTSSVFSITATDADKLEGNNSAQENTFSFKIDRTGDITQPAQIKWQVTTQNPGVAANDFSTGVLPTGIAQFDAGVSTYNLPISIFGDKVYELDESFSVKLSDAPANATIDPNAGTAQGVMRNDDEALVLKNVIPRFSHPLISAAYLAECRL